VAYSNIGTGNQNNFSNFLIYNDSVGDRWLLNTKSWNSTYGIKIKHTNADNSRSIIHNAETFDPSGTVASTGGFIGYGKHSSFRYAVVYNDDGLGVSPALTDPSAYTVQGMLFEHLTIVSAATASSNFRIQENYGTTGPLTIKTSIFYQAGGACQAINPDNASTRALITGWYYVNPSSTPKAYPFYADRNLYYNSAGNSNCFFVGNDGFPNPTNFAGWQALTGAGITRDPNSITSDPAFTSVGTGNLNITTSSPAATNCGSGNYCGAFRPGQTYGTVGVSNNTLLAWDGTYTAPAATTSQTAVSALDGRRRRRGYRQ
jgi:hypothetical protein